MTGLLARPRTCWKCQLLTIFDKINPTDQSL